jgi:hypothetical protein
VKADIRQGIEHLCFVPKADIAMGFVSTELPGA